jgi:hypothetical protein
VLRFFGVVADELLREEDRGEFHTWREHRGIRGILGTLDVSGKRALKGIPVLNHQLLFFSGFF